MIHVPWGKRSSAANCDVSRLTTPVTHNSFLHLLAVPGCFGHGLGNVLELFHALQVVLAVRDHCGQQQTTQLHTNDTFARSSLPFFHAVDVKHLFVLHFMPRLCGHTIVGQLQSKELLLKCVVVLGENKTPNQLSQNGQFECGNHWWWP